jgi:hypothetical protein
VAAGDRGRAIAERVVELVDELIADDGVDDDRGKHDGQRDRRCGHEREPDPEAHSSRSA